MYEIVKIEELVENSIYKHEIKAPQIAKKAKPGQFVMVRSGIDGERVPLTIADLDTEKGTISIVFMVVGKSSRLYSTLLVGDSYTDVVGPLGAPTHISKQDGKVVCVGGGTGTAVLHPITKGNFEAGNDVTVILGARNKDYLIFEEEMQKVSNDLKICTDDGSKGRHGFVTDALKELLEEGGVSEVVAIGPVPMMKFVSLLTKDYNVPTVVSLNPIMIDGTGMCGCCRVTVGGETKFACVDGPEFDGHQVDYDNLMMRLGAYTHEEKISNEKFCKSVEG
jgi:ferredoxin--NADP+ reductase